MALYEISTRTILTTATALAPLATIRASTAQRSAVREIHLSSTTATAGAIGLMRSTSLAVTPTGVTTSVQHEPAASPGGVALYTGWATAPGVGAVGTVFRRWAHSAAIGNTMIWTWDIIAALIIPLGNTATGELVLVNLNAAAVPTYELSVVVDE